MAADDGGVGPDAGAAPDECAAELPFSRNFGPGNIDVGEHTARPAEDIVGELDTVIERHIVLDLAAFADPDIRTDHDVLPDRTVLADRAVRQDVAEMPDP